MLTIGLVLAFGLFIIGVPIAVSFGLGAAIVLIFHNALPVSSISNMMYGNLDHFTWVAVPLFVFAGNLMVRSNSAKALLDFIQAVLGHITGGIAASAVIACVFFGALTGSGAATIAAIGTLMIPRMREMGYSDGFSTGLISVTGTLGNLIPPSLFFIIYGMLVEKSIASLFMAGVIPGMLAAALLTVTAVIICKVKHFKTLEPVNANARWKAFLYAIPALMIPVVILGGIYGGIFTPTEAATVACVIAILAGFWYKGMTWEAFKVASYDTLRVTSMLLFLICTATLLGKVLVLTGFPQILTKLVVAWELKPLAFIIGVSIVLLIMGVFMEGTPLLYVTLPIIMPCAITLNISLIHLGVVYAVAILIGQITPPVGIMLYVGSSIAKTPADVVIRGAIPFLIAMVVTLILVCAFPGISLFLPSMMR